MHFPRKLASLSLVTLACACTAKLPDGTTGSGGSSGGGGGGGGGGSSNAPSVSGTVYNSKTLLPLGGVMVQSGNNFSFSGLDGSYAIDIDGTDTIKFFDDIVYPSALAIPLGKGNQLRDSSVVPIPIGGELFDVDSSIITNRYLAGLTVGDLISFREDGLLSGAEVTLQVTNREFNHGIWALRIRWGEDTWANHFVIAEDVFGNIRLLEYNSIVVDMNHPPILLPELATIGQILIDLWGQSCQVVSTTATITPSAQLGIAALFEHCLQTQTLATGIHELWGPGLGLVATKKVGAGNDYFLPVSGILGGQRLGGELAAYDSSSATSTNPFLPGLIVGDSLVWSGTGQNSGRIRNLTVAGSTYMSNSSIAALILVTTEDFVPVETLWLAEDTRGNLRILQEVVGFLTTTFAWDRAPIWCPLSATEGLHLGVRSNGSSQEIEHVGLELSSNFGLGDFLNVHEVEIEADGGFEKQEWLWAVARGPLQINESTTAGWELSSGRLAGVDF